jgi:hypothetical protein
MKRTQRGRKKAVKGKGKRISLFYLSTLIVLFSVSASAGYIYFKPMFAFESTFIEDIESRRLKAGQKKEKEAPKRLYKSRGDEESIWYDAEFRKDSTIVNIENIIRQYIKPLKARLLDLYMDKEGVIYIDLSKGIRKNFKGDAFEESNIIASLYMSIKTSVPDFTALKILIEGKESESFGGHVDISRPIGEEITGSADNI